MENLIIWDESYDGYFDGIAADRIDDYVSFERWEDFSGYRRIFLRAELKWSVPRANVGFSGFEVLRQLRQTRVNCPIVICSYFSRDFFLSIGLVPYGFLRLRHAHPFVQLPTQVADTPYVKVDEKISDLQLQDALLHFSNPRGVVNEQFHYLKGVLKNGGKPVDNSVIDVVLKQLRGVILQTNQAKADQWERAFRAALTETDGGSYEKVVDAYKNKLQTLLPKVAREPGATINRRYPWRVLYVEDQERYRMELKLKLARKEVHCVTAANWEEARAKLEKDLSSPDKVEGTWKQNSITVVICDLRFESPEQDWDILQGYDIIQRISEDMDNFVSFVVLSNKRNDIRELQESMEDIRWRGFSKDSVFAEEGDSAGFQIFAEHIQQEGEEINNMLESIPRASAWHSPWKGKINLAYRTLYRTHRMSNLYWPREKDIGETAYQFVEEAQDTLFHLERGGDGSMANAFSDLKFMGGIKQRKPDQDALDKFAVKLIGRRITIGLTVLGWSPADISNLLKKRAILDDSADRQLFSAYLGMSSNPAEDIPSQLLIEERSWLRSKMGYTTHLPERRLYAALLRRIKQLQDDLRKVGCPDDFVDHEVSIGSVDNVEECWATLAEFSETYPKQMTEFYRDVEAVVNYRNNREVVNRRPRLRVLLLP